MQSFEENLVLSQQAEKVVSGEIVLQKGIENILGRFTRSLSAVFHGKKCVDGEAFSAVMAAKDLMAIVSSKDAANGNTISLSEGGDELVRFLSSYLPEFHKRISEIARGSTVISPENCLLSAVDEVQRAIEKIFKRNIAKKLSLTLSAS